MSFLRRVNVYYFKLGIIFCINDHGLPVVYGELINQWAQIAAPDT